ncbi:hypothetical protein [Roseomonas indoligenes]|uniref:Uncharacterized protein n=1 Tax=Roseomonas indoligenes TaxID=2820811 RepID=A0A940N3V0_9PROT|nr:hypothetical protein [Pararoseomonas indoligenes]MBP0496104.1 hypothetical protein [Pararoseomonas indoligenes]
MIVAQLPLKRTLLAEPGDIARLCNNMAGMLAVLEAVTNCGPDRARYEAQLAAFRRQGVGRPPEVQMASRCGILRCSFSELFRQARFQHDIGSLSSGSLLIHLWQAGRWA